MHLVHSYVLQMQGTENVDICSLDLASPTDCLMLLLDILKTLSLVS